jgi:hypothetical protein
MGMELQRPSYDLATVSGGPIEGTLFHALFVDETVPSIKKERQNLLI